jgi:hypothetical protein
VVELLEVPVDRQASVGQCPVTRDPLPPPALLASASRPGPTETSTDVLAGEPLCVPSWPGCVVVAVAPFSEPSPVAVELPLAGPDAVPLLDDVVPVAVVSCVGAEPGVEARPVGAPAPPVPLPAAADEPPLAFEAGDVAAESARDLIAAGAGARGAPTARAVLGAAEATSASAPGATDPTPVADCTAELSLGCVIAVLGRKLVAARLT